MKAVILEIRDGYAAALREDGVVVKTRANGAAVGDTVELNAGAAPFLVSRRKRIMRTAVAAVLALALTGGTFTWSAVTASAYVSLDTEESSVELAVNTFGRVVGVTALDDESAELAETLAREVRHKPLEEALDTAMDRLSDAADGEARTVVAGVTAGSEKRRAELSETVERCAKHERGGVRVHTMPLTPRERSEAKAHEQSPGRYAFEQHGGAPPPPARGAFPAREK